MLQAGFAKVEITPPLGSPIIGYFHPRYAAGVRDPLWARALALQAGGRPVVLLAFDLIAITQPQADAIRAAVSTAHGLPDDAIHLVSSHTHTGPATLDILGVPAATGYEPFLISQAAAAAAQALAGLAPARASLATGECKGIAFNRRYWMKDGVVRTNPGYRNPDIVRPAGPVDESLVVLLLEGQGRDVALVNFALHLDTVSGDQISADYPFYAAQTLAAGWPRPVEMMFANGAFGDINHCDFLGADRGAATADIGRRLGEATLAALVGRRPLPADEIACAAQMVTLHRRTIPPEQLAASRALAASAPADSYEGAHVYAREHVALAALPPTLEARVSAFRLGELRGVCLPGEVFTELSLAIKGHCGPVTAVLGNADGSVGYVPTRRAYDEGGYETMPARSSQLAAGSGETLAAAAIKVAAQV